VLLLRVVVVAYDCRRRRLTPRCGSLHLAPAELRACDGRVTLADYHSVGVMPAVSARPQSFFFCPRLRCFYGRIQSREPSGCPPVPPTLLARLVWTARHMAASSPPTRLKYSATDRFISSGLPAKIFSELIKLPLINTLTV
jgi:hypothetical protein